VLHRRADYVVFVNDDHAVRTVSSIVFASSVALSLDPEIGAIGRALLRLGTSVRERFRSGCNCQRVTMAGMGASRHSMISAAQPHSAGGTVEGGEDPVAG
jgi:hypothetical protein